MYDGAAVSAERVARSLLRLQSGGGFAAQHREPGVGLWIDVEGVGRCELPLTEATLAALLAHAVPSPFGYRDETRHDPSVRDGWEIPGTKVALDERAWAARFARGFGDIVEGLGLPSTTKVTPVLQKLVIYGPGQFFAPHRDSQTHPGTAGTLVVVLPSAHRGGDVVVTHAGRQVTVSTAKDASAGYVSFLGFFADCLHEVRPVDSGHRVALTYALEVEPQELPGFAGELADLEQSVQTFLSDEDDERPWLVYLLDHQYAEQSLDWSRLKNGDRVRSTALLEVADKLGCDCFLALADVREAYELSEEDADDEDDEDDRTYVDERALPSPAPDRQDDPRDVGPLSIVRPPPETGMLGALVERELALGSWIDRAGQPCCGTTEGPDRQCVVTTIVADERTPYESSSEPWTGNEGGSAEKWYHLAAVVLIPRGSELCAEVSRRLE